MTQGVNIAETEIVFIAELPKPKVRCVVVHRLSVPLYKQAVVIYPLASEPEPFIILFVLVSSEQIDHTFGELQ